MLLTFVEKVFGGFSHYYYGWGEKNHDLHYFVNNKAPIKFSHDTWDFGLTDFPVGCEYSMLLESELIHY